MQKFNIHGVCVFERLVTLRLGWLLGWTALLLGSMAQSAWAEPTSKPTVRYDYAARTLSDTLPHRRPFLMEVLAPGAENLEGLYVWQAESCAGVPDAASNRAVKRKVEKVDGKNVTTFEIRRLNFNTPYCIRAEVMNPVSDLDADKVGRALLAAIEFRRQNPRASQQALLTVLQGELGELGNREGIKKDALAQCRAHGDMAKCPKATVTEALRDWFFGSSDTFPATYNALNTLTQVQSKTFPGDVGEIANEVFKPPPGSDAEKAIKSAQLLLSLVAQANLQQGLDPIIAQDGEFSETGNAFMQAAGDLKTKAEAAQDAKCKPSGARTLKAEEKARQSEVDTQKKLLAATVGEAEKARIQARIDAEQMRLDQIAPCRSLQRLASAAALVQEDVKRYKAASVRLAESKAELDAALPSLIRAFPLVVSDVSVTELPGYTERAPFYISADVGALMPVFPGEGVDFALYVGVNFYFDAVDKEVPLAEENGFLKRFSLVAGITLNKVEDPSKSISGIVGDQSLVGGIGLRLTDYVRAGGGILLFDQKSENPTVVETSLRVTPYLSLSIDVDVVGVVRGAFSKGKEAIQ